MQDDYGSIWAYRAKWAYLLALVVVLLLPVFYVIYVSFNEHGFAARIYEFTFEWYRIVLGDKILVASLEWTGYLALAAVAMPHLSHSAGASSSRAAAAAGCCHAAACVAASNGPDCTDTMCTADCQYGTLDCGGACLCHEGRCAARLSTPPDLPE